MPKRKRKQDSKTPMPLGAAGTIKPIDQDKQKIINKKIISISNDELKILKQRRKAINFEKMNPISNMIALRGKKEVSSILFADWYLNLDNFRTLAVFPLRNSKISKTKHIKFLFKKNIGIINKK